MRAVFCVAGGSRHCLSPGPTYTRRHGGRLFLMRGEWHPHLPRDKGAPEQPAVRSSRGGDAFLCVLCRGFYYLLWVGAAPRGHAVTRAV